MSLWWRDDDALEWTPQLQRLVELSRANAVPVALAVIPAGLARDLPARLSPYPSVSVMQHGWSHSNHAPTGHKKCEFGDHRRLSEMLAQLHQGRTRLRSAFGGRFVEVLVPPWNRIPDALAGALGEVGWQGLSIFGDHVPATDIPCRNVHVDIIDWRGSRGFAGSEEVLTRLVGQLRTRRRAREYDSPLGLMTHHLNHDTGCWGFCRELMARSADHPGVVWLSADQLFPV